MVYYRKYRPQLISELDLVSVREKLTSILSSNSVPHAFLFVGSKGLGKTSAARIVAKAINCERRTANNLQLTTNKKDKKSEVGSQKLAVGSIEPCNKCSACISITNGSNVDVLEIDAASNRGIDEIRDLRERIKFSPASLRKKVYIIDEVHMLTTEAFNALLKTLEEPPAHAVFILCTTETHKLPATIMSRVFLVQFEKPTAEEIARSLWRVARGEELEIDEKVIEKIGELSDGAFRDGAKLLEELSLQSKGKNITLELLESLYKTGSTDNSVEKLLEQLKIKDMKGALEEVNKLAAANADFKQVIEKAADKLHGKLLDQVKKGNKGELGEIQKMLELLDEAYKGLRGAVLPQLPLELAVIEYSLDELRIMNHESREEKKAPVIVSEGRQSPSASHPELDSGSNQIPKQVRNDNNSLNLDLFRKLVDSINAENKILAGLLRGCKIEGADNGSIIIKAPSTFHLGKLSEKQNSDLVQAHINKILQKDVAITIK